MGLVETRGSPLMAGEDWEGDWEGSPLLMAAAAAMSRLSAQLMWAQVAAGLL